MNIEELLKICSDAIDNCDYEKAKIIVEELEVNILKLPENEMKLNHYANLGGILIDLGSYRGEENYILQGLGLLQQSELPDQKEKINVIHFYNLANGFLELRNLRSKKKSVPYIIDENFQLAKKYYRKAIQCAQKSDKKNLNLQCEIYVNYGNCLDSIGRRFEAIENYDEAIKINKLFGNALGNKGITLLGLAPLMQKYRHNFYQESLFLLKETSKTKLSNNQQSVFSSYLVKVESIINSHKEFNIEEIRNKKPRSKFHNFYLNFCERNQLFLTPTTVIGEKKQHIQGDPFFISEVFAPINDVELTDKYITFLNQIKQDYILARHLLVQSQFRSPVYEAIDNEVTLYYPLDYSANGSYIQLLKSAYKLAIDVLDKIAFFIKDYFNVISIKEVDVNFRKIFTSDPTAFELRPELVEKKNPYLFGLFDLSIDLRKGGDYEGIYLTRNLLTHRFLVIQLFAIETNSKIPTIDVDKFIKDCISVMKLARAALLYLILMVDYQEKKERDYSKPYFTIPSDIVDDIFRWKPRV